MLLDKILKWAQGEESIKAVILQGSRAGKGDIDAFSDYDICLFCDGVPSDVNPIGEVWVSIPEKLNRFGKEYPTRLVIFEGGVKVDFSFYTLDVLKFLEKKLPDDFDTGYQVLLDKEGLTENLPPPKYEGFQIQKPTQEEFQNLINEFWFEAYHVAVFLKRGDLWSVKFRSSGIQHQLLIKMIEWNEGAKHQWNYATNPIGKRMKLWVEEKTWQALHGVFAHFEKEDSVKAFKNMIALFREIAQESATLLGYDYPSDVDRKFSQYFEDLGIC